MDKLLNASLKSHHATAVGVPPEVSREWLFTQVYQQHENDAPSLREAACLRAQTPGTLAAIQDDDWFAGRWSGTLIGLGSEDSGFGYFCHENKLEQLRDGANASPELRHHAQALLDFWKTRTTSHKCRAAFSESLRCALPHPYDGDWMSQCGTAFPLYRLAGVQLNYDKLLRLGLNGLKREIEQHRLDTESYAARTDFYDGLLSVIETVQEAIRYYRDQAISFARESVSPEQRARFLTMSRTLECIEDTPPRSFHEAAQLFWIYAIVSNTHNYGRMDVYLGDFYARDRATGELTEEDGVSLLVSLWRLMDVNGSIANNRVTVGGLGRRNPVNADQFALAAMEATRRIHHILPNLTLRFHREQNSALYQKALDVIGEGNPLPMLYNDDVNVPAVAAAFRVPLEQAEQYLPFGCGEYILDHHSVGTPNGLVNLTKVLDITLHNGIDSFNGRREGLALGHLRDFNTFDALFDAYATQVDWYIDRLAEVQGVIYRETSRDVHFLAISLLFDDCVERGLPILGGGAAHLGGTMEAYGNITTADSLLAIKKLVYDEQKIAPDELLSQLEKNLSAPDSIAPMLAAVPKFGNDNAEADAMAQRVHDQVCNSVRDRASLGGMDSYLVVVINNAANVLFGRTTSASADGRRARMPLSNANQPTAGNDRHGLACVLSSMAKLNPAIHAGAVHNIKLSPEFFSTHRSTLEGILNTYWQRGGTQVMITVVSRGMLEDALEHPEQYPNLLVRVGGFSAYFVKLEPDIQQHILKRTLH